MIMSLLNILIIMIVVRHPKRMREITVVFTTYPVSIQSVRELGLQYESKCGLSVSKSQFVSHQFILASQNIVTDPTLQRDYIN